MSKYLREEKKNLLEGPELLERLRLDDLFYAYLRKYNVINRNQIESIKAYTEPFKQKTKLLELVQNEEQYNGFVLALLDTNQKSIVTNILEENPDDIRLNTDAHTDNVKGAVGGSAASDDLAKKLKKLLDRKVRVADIIQRLSVGTMVVARLSPILGPDEEAELTKDGQNEITKARKLLGFIGNKTENEFRLFIKALEESKQVGVLAIIRDEVI